MRIIEKVYAKKNNRAYRFLRDNEFFQTARLKHKQRHRQNSEMGSYAKIMGKVKLLKTRIQLKMNIKKNLLQKLKFYNFQIAKNKSLRNFRLKSLHEPHENFQPRQENHLKDTIKLPFIALELIDGQPVEIRNSREKSGELCELMGRKQSGKRANREQAQGEFSEVGGCVQEGMLPDAQSRLD